MRSSASALLLGQVVSAQTYDRVRSDVVAANSSSRSRHRSADFTELPGVPISETVFMSTNSAQACEWGYGGDNWTGCQEPAAANRRQRRAFLLLPMRVPGSLMVHPGDGHSNKSRLMPPTPPELARLAEQSRITPAVALPKIDEKAIPRSLRRRLAAEVREALVARHKAGESIKALSREFGISESGLRDLLTAEEMLYRKQPITPEDIDLAVQLYASGLTVKQVVKRLSYPIGTIRRVLRERGVTMRSHSTRQTKGTR